MATLNVFTTSVAYDDPTATNAPTLKHFDRASKVQNIAVTRPTSAQYTLSHRQAVTAFTGVRELNTDETTSFKMASLGKSVYALAHVGGAHPFFRDDRFIDLADTTVSVTVNNNNNTVTFTVEGPEDSYFDDVLFGDIMVVDEPFSALNQGEWVVIGKDALSVTAKTNSCTFEADDETVEIDSLSQPVTIYSPDGVQTGDKIELVSGFSPGSLRTYTIIDVTPDCLWFTSTDPLAEETVVDASIRIYSDSKKYVRIETNGEIEISVNENPFFRLSTIMLSTGDKFGWLDTCGPVYSLSVRSLEPSLVQVNVLSCE